MVLDELPVLGAAVKGIRDSGASLAEAAISFNASSDSVACPDPGSTEGESVAVAASESVSRSVLGSESQAANASTARQTARAREAGHNSIRIGPG